MTGLRSEPLVQVSVPWADVYRASPSRLELPADAVDLIVTGAASPRVPTTMGGPTKTLVADVAEPVRVEQLPTSIRSLEFVMEDDLYLEMVCEPGSLPVTVRSEMLSWFGCKGKRIASLKAIESSVGAVVSRAATGDQALFAAPTECHRLEMVCGEILGASVGWISCNELVVVGNEPLFVRKLDGELAAEARIGRLSVESRRVLNQDRLAVGAFDPGTSVTQDGKEARLIVGDSFEYNETEDLSVRHGAVEIRHGTINGLCLVEVAEVVVGRDEAAGDRADVQDAISAQLGYGLASRVTGSTQRLFLKRRGAIAGDARHGFSARRIEADETAEVSGLNASSFNLYSAKILGGIRRLGLWVPVSTHDARRLFERQVVERGQLPAPALFELAHQRKELLALAQDSKQDGHVLAVLREAEKDARRASLPTWSREWVLLELWRWLLGYGERILWPILAAVPLLFVLGAAEVGWARILSADWWSGWGSTERFEAAMNFALPGVDFLGLDGTGGVWGVLAKGVSVVFLASAVTAAVRVVRRGD